MYINNLITGSLTLGSGGSEPLEGHWQIIINDEQDMISSEIVGSTFILTGEHKNSRYEDNTYIITLLYEEDQENRGYWMLTIMNKDNLDENDSPQIEYSSITADYNSTTQFTDEHGSTAQWITQ